ncbi:hypothetical protein [Moheibacter stercoris]|uniref:Chain length determinant protein n=1 Tax=Moheibacter stercoris TaxID=1628251 RepID=A0ABV2LTR2_9FLAO
MESNTNSSQEIDLSYLSKKTGHLFDKIGYSIYRFIKFLIKNIWILLVLLIVGGVIGYLLDNRAEKLYKHEVIVIPNFSSNSYLYNSIQNLEYKNSKIVKAQVEPIIDIYQFIQERYQNLEIAKYMSENNIQLDKFNDKNAVEKLYRYHLMTIYTKGEDSKGQTIDSLLNTLNADPYYLSRQSIEQQNLNLSISEIEKSIESVNAILNKIGQSSSTAGDLNIEMYSELNNLINSKKSLVEDRNKAKVFQLEQSKIIYDSSKVLNIKESSTPKMILLPIVLFVLFLGANLILILSKKYKNKTSQNS